MGTKVAGCLGVMLMLPARDAAATLPQTPGDAGGLGTVIDSILKLDMADYLLVRRGRLLGPSDRSNLSGPFVMSRPGATSIYSAAGAGAFMSPNAGLMERDDGLVAAGNCRAGRTKYFLGVFNLDSAHDDLMVSGGVHVALLGTGPGPWGSGGAFDERNVVTMGVGFQYQKRAAGTKDPQNSGDSANANMVMGDLRAEKTLSRVGTVFLEATYYRFAAGESTRQTTYILASFRTPDYPGIGRVQPIFRWHQASTQSSETKRTMLDAFVTYLIHGHDLRVTAGYQRTDLGHAIIGNAIQAGLQLRK